MTRWKWENVWGLWALLAMFVFPWLVAFTTVPHLMALYQTAELRHALLLVLAFGAGYGIAAICFGLGIEAIGIALNFAIALGTATAVGSAIPLLWFHSASIFTRQGFVIEAGIGIVIIGIAGAGSALQNLGIAFGGPLLRRAADLGAGAAFQSNVVWAPLLTATLVPYLLFCARLWRRNRSWNLFFAPRTAAYWWFAVLMAALWFSSFVVYGAATVRMADLGPVLGWPLFMSAIILTSNVWGLALGEWKGASRGSIATMFAGLSALILGFCTLAWSSRMA
jgi:L-rhamnose-H+ transport protein